MSKLPLAAGPFTHQGNTISRTMTLVMVALAPATLCGFYLFGLPSLYLFCVTVLSCVAFEALCLRMMNKPVQKSLQDGSAILTGWILAMTLPPYAPWWIGVVGAFIAIVVAKQIFGGIGQNLFNPAMVARVALLISFPLEMTQFISPVPLMGPGALSPAEAAAITFGGAPIPDAVSSATVLGHLKTELGLGHTVTAALSDTFGSEQQFLGSAAGSMGETSALLLAGGGILLLATRVITWHIPVSLLAGLLGLSGIMHLVSPSAYPGIDIHLLAGATIMGAFFIATDLVTSPVSKTAQLVYGFSTGVLIYVIRTWGGYPEGMAFAVLIMNAATPLLDRYMRPRIYGRDKKNRPLTLNKAEKA